MPSDSEIQLSTNLMSREDSETKKRRRTNRLRPHECFRGPMHDQLQPCMWSSLNQLSSFCAWFAFEVLSFLLTGSTENEGPAPQILSAHRKAWPQPHYSQPPVMRLNQSAHRSLPYSCLLFPWIGYNRKQESNQMNTKQQQSFSHSKCSIQVNWSKYTFRNLVCGFTIIWNQFAELRLWNDWKSTH